jgi:hypothetical protein
MLARSMLLFIALMAGCSPAPPQPSQPAPAPPPAVAAPVRPAPPKEEPPLADVWYDFKGDIVGKMTLAEFKEKHANEYTGKTSPKDGYTLLVCDYNKTIKSPTFAGRPACATYIFEDDLLAMISIAPTPRTDVDRPALTTSPLEAATEKFGPPASKDASGVSYWKSMWSLARYDPKSETLELINNASKVKRSPERTERDAAAKKDL